MAEEVERLHLIQANTSGYMSPELDFEAEVKSCLAPRLDAASDPLPDSPKAELAGDKLDCMQQIAAPCHAISLPQATPLLAWRTLPASGPRCRSGRLVR